ncbi:hypothetical protein Rin_00005510 [Candidatus Regiella insecticola 5.15]|uniref:Uncharacterized protein n=1 Tax=Candidatus Regiella insecticola 5.15 TaxID=1005043 RepID=G2GXQ8_9ENTR|nr:hypothetical protein [Candidatus Regiella insecticola]EGY29465.1 hypothetical protein Rin_00005510 [Candidatus Regiella insecticola 5.15]
MRNLLKNKGDSLDDVAVGKLLFYTSLREALKGKGCKLGNKEVGLLDAINDTLQHLKLVAPGKTFYKS